MSDEKLLFKGHVIKPGDHIKATDSHSGSITFYRVVRVWGSHGVFRPIAEGEAGPNPIELIVQREPRQ